MSTDLVFKKYCIINTDRWPITPNKVDGHRIYIGQYGSTYVCDGFGIFYEIASFNKDKKQITTKTNKIVDLMGEPNFELFMQVIGNEWNTKGKVMWSEDEDRTDYVPYYYTTLDNYTNNKSTAYNSYSS